LSHRVYENIVDEQPRFLARSGVPGRERAYGADIDLDKARLYTARLNLDVSADRGCRISIKLTTSTLLTTGA
jgi:hypothetical protein